MSSAATLIIQGVLLIAAVGFYIPSQLQLFGKLKGMDSRKPWDFWGSMSYMRKYKRNPIGFAYYGIEAPNNWYYKFIRTKYVERWPTSTWLTVWATDGYHLFQFISWRCIYAVMALGTPWFWWVFLSLCVGHAFFFWLFQKLFTRKP